MSRKLRKRAAQRLLAVLLETDNVKRSLKTIVDEYEVTERTVRNWVQEFGIKLKNFGKEPDV